MKKAADKTVKKNEFNPADYVRPGLSAEEVIEIKEAFDFFDTDGSGEVSVREFVDALRSYGFDTKNPEIYQMIADMDEDGKFDLQFPTACLFVCKIKFKIPSLIFVR